MAIDIQGLLTSYLRPAPQLTPGYGVRRPAAVPTVQPIQPVQPAIDIAGLFTGSGMSPLARQALMQREGEALAANVGRLGSAAAYYAPQRAAAMRRGLQGEQRSPEAVVANEIRKLDLNTEEGQQQAVTLMGAINPQGALALQQRFQDRAAAQQAEIAQQQRDALARQNAIDMVLGSNLPPEIADRFARAIAGGGDIGRLLEEFTKYEVEAAPLPEFSPMTSEDRAYYNELIDQDPNVINALGEGWFNVRQQGQPSREKFLQDLHSLIAIRKAQGITMPASMSIIELQRMYDASDNPTLVIPNLWRNYMGGDAFPDVTLENGTRAQRAEERNQQVREDLAASAAEQDTNFLGLGRRNEFR